MILPLLSSVTLATVTPLATTEIPFPEAVIQQSGVRAFDPAIDIGLHQNLAQQAMDDPPQGAEPSEPLTQTEDGPGGQGTEELPQNVIVVEGEAEAPPQDPLEDVNAASYEVTQEIDSVIVEPVADAYKEGLPKPIRKGARNFFRNLLEPVNSLNYLLQLKPGKAVETLGRFTINSTVGIAGLVDVAKRKPFNLPHRRNGFANTMGYYGIGQGPFLVLPLVGPTTLRDFIGNGLDQAVMPTVVGKPFGTPAYSIPSIVVTSLERRIRIDEQLEEIRASDDPYLLTRESYLCHREAQIAALKNRPPPRDCSVEALLIEAGLLDQVSDETPQPEPIAAQAAEQPPVAEPKIIMISKPVIQPIPTEDANHP